jgi:hypothetical protein
MKLFFAIVVLLFSIPASCQSEKKAVMQQSDATQTRSMLDDIRAVSRQSKEINLRSLCTFTHNNERNLTYSVKPIGPTQAREIAALFRHAVRNA